ncbi:MAG TPA: Flp family type IVb pilin [Dehalococcoidia bacterium]|nr:Flp family type IVb pilin [Dehalococcoidia bacterium]
MTNQLLNTIRAARDEESGQALSEYAFIIVLVVIVLVSALILFAGSVAEPLISFAEYLGGGSSGSS